MKKSRVDRALANHKRGFNCAQAVACAYCDLVGMEEETVFRAAEAFGAGMGGMDATCGAISGAVMLAGLKNSGGDPGRPVTKGGSYMLSRKIVKGFADKNGSIVCKELKGLGTGCPLRSCDGCIEDAAVLAEEILFAE